MDDSKKEKRTISNTASSKPSTETKSTHQRKSPSDDSDISGSDNKVSHQKSSDVKGDHSNTSGSKTKTPPKNIRSLSPQSIASDVSNAEPSSFHQRTSEMANIRSSSPEPFVFSTSSTANKKKSPPSPQPIDSDSADSGQKSTQIKSNKGNPPAIEQIESNPSSPEPPPPPPSRKNVSRLPDPKGRAIQSQTNRTFSLSLFLDQPKSSSPINEVADRILQMT